MKIAVLDTRTLGEDMDLGGLEKFGEVEYFQNMRETEVGSRLSDKEVLITNKVKLNRENLKHLKNLKLICLTATGYNNVDIEYTNEREITVCNVAGYSTASVVQHTFSMLFHMLSRIDVQDRFVKSGKYGSSGNFTNLKNKFPELDGKRWGIIGLGNIGSKVAGVATCFGAEVSYYSTSGSDRATPYKRVELEELLSESDIISIHAPLNKDTEHLINLENLKKMKPTSILINVARGPIVKESDLAEALNRGYIGGACLDVFEVEPLTEKSPLYRVRDMEKLVMTPHVAWSSIESRNRLVQEIIKNIEGFVEGAPRNVVKHQ